MRTLVDGSGLTVTVAKYLTPNGTDINKFGIIPDIEVKMNINPILQRDIGTRKDKQYRAGEKELINIINRKNKISEFQHDTTNLNAFLKINKEEEIFSLN
jgi:carboxyl-terminal processing protease